MSVLVIDASIVLAVILPDENNERANSAMEIVALHGAWAPLHWPLEIANGLLVAQRRRRLDRSLRSGALRDLAALSIEVDDTTNERAWNVISNLADRNGLTAYDAAYLELAIRMHLPLATLDGDLAEAALAEKVPVFGEP